MPFDNKTCNKLAFLTEEASEREKNEFLSEIEFMKNVGHHKNIITMIACCTKANHVYLVVEYARHGDLLHWLKDKRQNVSS